MGGLRFLLYLHLDPIKIIHPYVGRYYQSHLPEGLPKKLKTTSRFTLTVSHICKDSIYFLFSKVSPGDFRISLCLICLYVFFLKI